LAEGPEQRAQRRVGTMVRDKYRIDAFIATGSMANVYASTHRNGSRVALKILHDDLARDASMAERFRREGYFANAIGHPGVVRAIDDDVAEDGCVFIVMELLEGENLEQRRQRLGGKIPVPEVLQIADAMLDVLSAAHDHAVLHRDLKPENVFITRKNDVKLLDFGIARFNDGRRSSDMTAAGMVLGTPAFMPPEQALGRREDVDARSDIWGVGATLFMVITGEAVHAGGDAKTKLIATARTPARPIRDVAPHVPRAVASVIDRALAFDKARRWADANAMREALRWARMSLDEEVASRLEHPVEIEPPPVPTRRTTLGDEDPTLAGQSFDSTQSRTTEPSFGDSTARRAPVGAHSLRRSHEPEPVPATERMPQAARLAPPPIAADGSGTETAERPAPHPGPSPDAAALLRAALAKTALPTSDGSDARTSPRFGPRAAEPSAARAGAGAPPSPPTAGTPRAISGRPSVTPENPGPLLSTIVPKKTRSAGVVLVPILIGALAGSITYVVVVQQRAASSSHAAPAAEAAAPPPPSVSAVPSGGPAPEASLAAPATPSATPPLTAPAAASSARPPKKARPKTRPKAPSTPAATANAQEAPAPAPVESVPSTDPD